MRGLTVADILRLIAADDDPRGHLQQVVQWQIDRLMSTVRAMTGAVIAILAALIAALLSGESIADWLLVLVVVASVLALAFAWSRYEEARNLEADYVVALNIMRELAPLAPLVRLYPQLNVV